LTAKQKALTEAEESQKIAIPGFSPIENVSITKDSIKNIKDAAPMIQGVKVEMDALKKMYDKSGVKLIGPEAARLKAKVRKIQLLLKSKAFLDLGVLNGPDLTLLDEIVPNVSGIKAGAKKAVFGDVFAAQMDELQSFINNKGGMFYRANGFEESKTLKPGEPSEQVTGIHKVGEQTEPDELDRLLGL
jgi:hypothetical protein